MPAQMGLLLCWVRGQDSQTTEAEESQGGNPALHHTSRSARIKDDDTTAISTVVPGYGIRLRRTAVPHCRSLVVERRHEAFQCTLAFLADMFRQSQRLRLEASSRLFQSWRESASCWWRQRRSQERSHHSPQQAAGRVSALFSGLHKATNQMMEFTRDPFSFRVDNFPKEAEDIEDQFLDLVHDSEAKAVFARKA